MTGHQDPVLFNDWHVVAAVDEVSSATSVTRSLMGERIDLKLEESGALVASCAPNGGRIHCRQKYGLIWVCLGSPSRDVLTFTESSDPRFGVTTIGPYGVATSGPRIAENFLDMTHFPFVHRGILGVPAHPEVRDYTVENGGDEADIVSNDCLFWQPVTTASGAGSLVRYQYRVLRPLTVVLNKRPDNEAGSAIAILLTIQPIQEEYSIAWMLFAAPELQRLAELWQVRQGGVFFQDKPILENQRPKRLPLDSHSEISLRADRMSTAYRRYLMQLGLQYGVIRTASA